MNFLIDAQLPRRLARKLTQKLRHASPGTGYFERFTSYLYLGQGVIDINSTGRASASIWSPGGLPDSRLGPMPSPRRGLGCFEGGYPGVVAPAAL